MALRNLFMDPWGPNSLSTGQMAIGRWFRKKDRQIAPLSYHWGLRRLVRRDVSLNRKKPWFSLKANL